VSRFEYTTVVWRPNDDGSAMLALLNELGSQGWEAVGMAPRATESPMPGMGASIVPEVVVLLKRSS
jgi:hypothetical protein